MDEDAIRALVVRLARPHRSGGHVVEGAAIRAEGPEFDRIEAWIVARGGVPEQATPKAAPRGLYAARFVDTDAQKNLATTRYLLPPGALDAPAAESSRESEPEAIPPAPD